jgi:hypothetical protein
VSFPHQNGAVALDTPADRARFVSRLNALRHRVDVDSLVIATHSAVALPDDAHPELEHIWLHSATLHGGFVAGEEREGLRFFVNVEFTHFEAHDGQPARLEIESLLVGLELGGDEHAACEVIVDITTYEYPSGINDNMMPIANFPVEWRHWVANRVMALVLAS